MAPHSDTPAWRTPWMEEPGRLRSMGSLRVGHDWVTSLSRIGEGNGNPLQCSCLENPRTGEPGGLPSMGSHRVRHDWSDLAAAELVFTEKAMATHSSTLAWKIPWMEEPGRLQSMGLLRVWQDWATSLSRTGEGNGNPLQCSCLENPRNGAAWWAAVYGVTQSWTGLKRLSSSRAGVELNTRLLAISIR